MVSDWEVVMEINRELVNLLDEISRSHGLPKDYALRLLRESLRHQGVVEAIWSKMLVLRKEVYK